MRTRCRRSERGDVSLEPVLLVLGMALALTIVTVVVIGIVQHRLLVTLGYLAGGLVLVGVAAVGWDRVERIARGIDTGKQAERRLARESARRR